MYDRTKSLVTSTCMHNRYFLVLALVKLNESTVITNFYLFVQKNLNNQNFRLELIPRRRRIPINNNSFRKLKLPLFIH
jgi:hypothetical protein